MKNLTEFVTEDYIRNNQERKIFMNDCMDAKDDKVTISALRTVVRSLGLSELVVDSMNNQDRKLAIKLILRDGTISGRIKKLFVKPKPLDDASKKELEIRRALAEHDFSAADVIMLRTNSNLILYSRRWYNGLLSTKSLRAHLADRKKTLGRK